MHFDLEIDKLEKRRKEIISHTCKIPGELKEVCEAYGEKREGKTCFNLCNASLVKGILC